MELKKSTKETWTGRYKGIAFEISCWDMDKSVLDGRREKGWAYYILLNLDSLPEDVQESFWLPPIIHNGKRVYYEMHNLHNIPFHYGITWYSKEAGLEGGYRVVKIGCDFNHYRDWDWRLSPEDVYGEVKNTIDSIHNMFDMKYYCSTVGGFHAKNEGEFLVDGEFLSFKGMDWREEMNWDRVPKNNPIKTNSPTIEDAQNEVSDYGFDHSWE